MSHLSDNAEVSVIAGYVAALALYRAENEARLNALAKEFRFYSRMIVGLLVSLAAIGLILVAVHFQ